MFRKLWVVCDEVRSGAHIDQFKDYILAVLFFRFASIKFGLDYEAAKKTSPENLGAEVFTPLRWRFGLPEGFFPDFTSKVLGSAKARAVTAQKLFSAFGQLDEPGLDTFEKRIDRKIAVGPMSEDARKAWFDHVGLTEDQKKICLEATLYKGSREVERVIHRFLRESVLDSL